MCRYRNLLDLIKDALVFLYYFDRMVNIAGTWSDYAGFLHYLGITSMDLTYTYDRV